MSEKCYKCGAESPVTSTCGDCGDVAPIDHYIHTYEMGDGYGEAHFCAKCHPEETRCEKCWEKLADRAGDQPGLLEPGSFSSGIKASATSADVQMCETCGYRPATNLGQCQRCDYEEDAVRMP